MAWFLDLKLITGGFYLTLFQLLSIGMRYKPESLMFTAAVYRFNVYFTVAIEE